jgi:hypothetical protein
VQRDVEQAAEPSGEHLRQRTDGSRVERTIAEDAQPARTLGDEEAPVWHERDAPRMIDAFGHDRDVNASAASCCQVPRAGAQCVSRSRSTSAGSLTGWRTAASGRRLLRVSGPTARSHEHGQSDDDVRGDRFVQRCSPGQVTAAIVPLPAPLPPIAAG